MRNSLISIVFASLAYVISPSFAGENKKDWTVISGKWTTEQHWFAPVDTSGQTIPYWLVVRSKMNEDSRWDELSFDFKMNDTAENQQFGVLLNFQAKDDYQLLRICNTATKPVIQMLRWQYGDFRVWQEINLPAPLSPEIVYNVSIQRAPLVDIEDWRQWKIILSDKMTSQILLKQGIENEQPAFGLGNVGLYAEKAGIRFGKFSIQSKTILTTTGSLKLAPLFSDGMVLQQRTKIRIWGKAQANEKVKIEIAGKSYYTYSNSTGDWFKSISPLIAQRGLELKVNAGKDSVTVHDIAVGEVWLASGQSNMEMRTWQSDVTMDAKKIVTDDNLRFFLQPNWPSAEPCSDSGGNWVKADSSSVMGWSAVALSFALELRKKLNVPVGIISSNWGGTAIESWIPRSRLATDSLTLPILNRFKQFQKALINREPTETRFPWCWDVPGQRHTPGDLYNGMIAPHIPFVIKGVIWYQGESNSYRSKQYEHLFPMLISSWREMWQNPKMKFYFVQLAGYDGKQSGSEIEDAWPHLREAQMLTLNKLKNTGMAVTIDLGQELNIHPPYKKQVGIRLSNLALHDVYGFPNIVRSSPIFKKAIFKSGQSIIYFSETGSGLKLLKGHVVDGFTIAGEDHFFVPAIATIQPDGRSILVLSKKVKNPVAVRYAWENFPKNANLGNSANLPASPFRTDNWFLNTDNDR